MKNIPLIIDFDGTIAEHSYPSIGEPVPHAFETMKQWQKEGALLILFTMRSGKELADAVNFCKENGIVFYGVQTNPTQSQWTSSPKAYGELIIDDAAAGCPIIIKENKRPYVNWLEIDKIVRIRLSQK